MDFQIFLNLSRHTRQSRLLPGGREKGEVLPSRGSSELFVSIRHEAEVWKFDNKRWLHICLQDKWTGQWRWYWVLMAEIFSTVRTVNDLTCQRSSETEVFIKKKWWCTFFLINRTECQNICVLQLNDRVYMSVSRDAGRGEEVKSKSSHSGLQETGSRAWNVMTIGDKTNDKLDYVKGVSMAYRSSSDEQQVTICN